jgi:hypothetical protein
MGDSFSYAMVDIAELVEVADERTDAQLQALYDLVKASGKYRDWKSLRHDFTNSDWKPMLHIVPSARHPYHAYAVYRGVHAEREGQYTDKRQAERCAIDLAMMCNKNHLTADDWKKD